MGRGPRGVGSGGHKRLPVSVVRAVVLLDREGRSVKEISNSVHVSIAMVSTLLTSTIKELREKYGAEAWPE